MKGINRANFLKKSVEILEQVFDTLDRLPAINLKDLDNKKTAFVIVDMINGFTREGTLKSPRVEALIPQIAVLSKACGSMEITKLAFADCHTGLSPEFGAYPVHCMSGTAESEMVDELKEAGGYILIPKNSTNGFHESQFQDWLKANPQIDTFIVVGDCTDICIQQFTVTLKTWFNMQNLKSRIIVPLNCVDTYDLGMHNGDLMDIMALYSMMGNGVEIVQEIDNRQ